VPDQEQAALAVRLARAHAGDAANMHYGLAAADFEEFMFIEDGDFPDGGSMGQILAEYARASYGRFNTTDVLVSYISRDDDVESLIWRVRFSVGGHALGAPVPRVEDRCMA
jgi:hypothetical protein